MFEDLKKEIEALLADPNAKLEDIKALSEKLDSMATEGTKEEDSTVEESTTEEAVTEETTEEVTAEEVTAEEPTTEVIEDETTEEVVEETEEVVEEEKDKELEELKTKLEKVEKEMRKLTNNTLGATNKKSDDILAQEKRALKDYMQGNKMTITEDMEKRGYLTVKDTNGITVKSDIYSDVVEEINQADLINEFYNKKITGGSAKLIVPKDMVQIVASTLELQENPTLDSTLVKTDVDLATYRAQVLVSEEIISDTDLKDFSAIDLASKQLQESLLATRNSLVVQAVEKAVKAENTVTINADTAEGKDIIKEISKAVLSVEAGNVKIVMNTDAYAILDTVTDSTGRSLFNVDLSEKPSDLYKGNFVAKVPNTVFNVVEANKGKAVIYVLTQNSVAVAHKDELEVTKVNHDIYGRQVIGTKRVGAEPVTENIAKSLTKIVFTETEVVAP